MWEWNLPQNLQPDAGAGTLERERGVEGRGGEREREKGRGRESTYMAWVQILLFDALCALAPLDVTEETKDSISLYFRAFVYKLYESFRL